MGKVLGAGGPRRPVVTSWTEPEKVAEYVGRIGRVPQRLAGEAALVELLPATPTRAAPDLGCGDGRLIALVLDLYHDVEEIVGVDNSPPMLDLARRSASGPATRASWWRPAISASRWTWSAPSTW